MGAELWRGSVLERGPRPINMFVKQWGSGSLARSTCRVSQEGPGQNPRDGPVQGTACREAQKDGAHVPESGKGSPKAPGGAEERLCFRTEEEVRS